MLRFLSTKEVDEMVIYTGDTHGYTVKILTITDKLSLTKSNTIVIQGDAGYNYYGNE